MIPDLTPFTFNGAEVYDGGDLVARVPAGVTSTEMLFDVLKRELRLRDYFGDNWNALDECLRDLWWIKDRRVIILHEDLPELEPKELSIYLQVLSRCVKDWHPGEEHKLVVVFPRETRDTIYKVFNQG